MILYSVPCPSLSPVPGKCHSGIAQRSLFPTPSLAQLAKLMSQSRLLAVHVFVTLEASPLFSLKENWVPISDGLYLGVTWTINKYTH